MDQPFKTPGNLPVEAPDISFQVMPQEGMQYAPPKPAPLMPVGQPMKPGSMPPLSPPHVPTGGNLPQEPEPSIWHNKWIYIIFGAVIVLALAASLYFLVGSKKTDTTADSTQTVTTKLPKVWLSQYFGSETCVDETICGDTADTDKDGLNNYDEFKAGTNPTTMDTDNDGLADGDEVNIYKTDPTLKYTDRRDVVAQNNWTDGFQVKGGYDPLTPGFKFTDERKTQIATDTTNHTLHEPTITTLK
jgi:hypothetical protein